ncbi:hypothetical protein [Blastococcus sp. URHD0036]|uniref:hypothetical protein n=1 Tax=Blastococcus sp. URHD0036 TaxID=1380356 RepID=UPI0012DF1A9F|nr:hypothetical protein [Blastococcus sp. URHD0036]
MLWFVVAISALVFAGVAGTCYRLTRKSAIGEVIPGRFAALAKAALAPPPALMEEISGAGSSPTDPGDNSAPGSRLATGAPQKLWSIGRRSALGDALVPGAIAGAVGAHTWLASPQSVLDAMHALTHDQVSTSLDLWNGVRENGYQLWSGQSIIKWRGHVGEQQVMEQLTPWLGDRAQLEPLSNNPGSDLSIDGRDFNVKLTENYANVAPSHFADNPDVPIIINSNAANIPSDALHVDLSKPFDVAMLDGHHVIVADGLTLSGAEDALMDAFGPAAGGIHGAGDLGDAASSALQDTALPVLGSAIRVVRSGFREGALLKHHGDTGRLVKNITTDVAVTGGGVAVGGTVGHSSGAGSTSSPVV